MIKFYKTPLIFPTLLGNKKWVEVNLDRHAVEFGDLGINPLIDPLFCSKWVEEITENLGADYTYGGYLELRTSLWRDHYHNPKKMRHLGIDYNVPPLTPVAVPFVCECVFTYKDLDQNGGWGGMAVFKYNGHDVIIYGHLEHKSLPEVGKIFSPGDIIGRTGRMDENGGWYPHLHAQFQSFYFSEIKTYNFNELDGYARNDLPSSGQFSDVFNPSQFIPMIEMEG